VGCNGLDSIYTWEKMVQGTYISKRMVFWKSCSMVAWKKWQVRWHDARYACLVQIRVITGGSVDIIVATGGIYLHV
jgi:hypothetical protein